MSFIKGLSDSLANTKTKQQIGIGGFVGFARVNESTKYSNTVPVDVLEDGSNASDDILNNPITVTIVGNVGDIMVPDRQFPEIIPPSLNSLGEISALLPATSQQQFQRLTQINDQARDLILQAERIERIGQKAFDFVSGTPQGGKTPQEKFVDYMEAVHFSRLPIEISTSYKNYKDMALSELTIDRNNSDGVLTFSASFTQISFAQLLFTAVTKVENPSPAVSDKTSGQKNNGGQNPENNEESVISVIFR